MYAKDMQYFIGYMGLYQYAQIYNFLWVTYIFEYISLNMVMQRDIDDHGRSDDDDDDMVWKARLGDNWQD